ncbi:MAG: SAM-dependent methyltransferase, partial [Pseudomonadota bacterium]
VAQWLKGQGRVIGLDLLPIEPLEHVDLIQGDFTEDEALNALTEKLDGQPVQLVLSDMAPNMSGMRAVDQPRAIYLVELALDFAAQHVAPGGTLLAKAFQGEGFDALVADLRGKFSSVSVVKPKASRPRSREVYVLARGAR